MNKPYSKQETADLIKKITGLKTRLENITPDPEEYKEDIKDESANYIRFRILETLRRIPVDELETADDSTFNKLINMGFHNFADIYQSNIKDLTREFKITRPLALDIHKEVEEAADDVKGNVVLCIDRKYKSTASVRLITLICEYRTARQLKKECDAAMAKYLEDTDEDLKAIKILGSSFRWFFASKAKKANASEAYERLISIDLDECETAIDKLQKKRNVLNSITDNTAWGMFEKQQKVYGKILRETEPDLLFIFGHDITTLLEIREIEEWCRLDTEEQTEYERSVLTRSFADMRQVSWSVADLWASADLEKSCKAGKLAEIIREATAAGERVIVFSYFMRTLWKLEKALGERCMQPITAGTIQDVRVKIAKAFDNSEPGTVLPIQITYGEPALNLKTRAAVVICEPQLNPYIEKQAINLAFRPGKRREVEVHHLLCKNSIDEPINSAVKNGVTVSEEAVVGMIDEEYENAMKN